MDIPQQAYANSRITLARVVLDAGFALHGLLARAHDLAQVESYGVATAVDLARETTREAGEWLQRLGS